MKDNEPHQNDAATFKIKQYPLDDWRLVKEGVDQQELLDNGGVWKRTILHDVPLAEIFDRKTIANLSGLKASQEKNQ